MRRFLLTAPAKRDLEEIRSYLNETAGPAVAREILKEIRASLGLLGSQPGLGHFRQDLTSRALKFWLIYSYLIVYDPQRSPIEVIRVLHAKRDIENVLS